MTKAPATGRSLRFTLMLTGTIVHACAEAALLKKGSSAWFNDCPDYGKMMFLFGLANLHHCQTQGDTSASVSSLEAAKSPVEVTKPDGKGKRRLNKP